MDEGGERENQSTLVLAPEMANYWRNSKNGDTDGSREKSIAKSGTRGNTQIHTTHGSVPRSVADSD